MERAIEAWARRQNEWCERAAAGDLDGMRAMWEEAQAAPREDRARQITLRTRGTRYAMDALQRAALEGRAEVVRWLVEDLGAKADGEPYDHYGETLSGDTVFTDEQKRLVAGPGREHLARAMYWTGSAAPLHLAAARGHTGVIRLLVRLGARADLRAASNREQAHFAAAFHNRVEALRCLVDELGLDPAARHLHSGTVLGYAARGCAVDAFRWLADRLQLGGAGGQLSPERARRLLGVAVGVQMPGDHAMVELLAGTYGATLATSQLVMVEYAGRTAESFERVMSLVEGGRVTARDARLPVGDTVLNRIAAADNVGLLQHLVAGAARVDPSVRSRLGEGPLTAAVKAGATGAVRFLAEHGGGALLDPADERLRAAVRRATPAVRLAVTEASAERARAERGAVLALADAGGPLPVLDVARICASYVAPAYDVGDGRAARRAGVRILVERPDEEEEEEEEADGEMFDLFG